MAKKDPDGAGCFTFLKFPEFTFLASSLGRIGPEWCWQSSSQARHAFSKASTSEFAHFKVTKGRTPWLNVFGILLQVSCWNQSQRARKIKSCVCWVIVLRANRKPWNISCAPRPMEIMISSQWLVGAQLLTLDVSVDLCDCCLERDVWNDIYIYYIYWLIYYHSIGRMALYSENFWLYMIPIYPSRFRMILPWLFRFLGPDGRRRQLGRWSGGPWLADG